jgi:hypothetical protein
MPTPTMAATVSVADAVPNSSTVPAQPKVPLLSQVPSGSQAQRYERVMITDVNLFGEGPPSAEVILEVNANNVLVVQQFETKFSSNEYPGKPTGFNVYVTTGASGTETRQNGILISPPANPTTGTVVSGALAAITALVKTTYVTANGESLPSGEVSQTVALNSVLTVTSPVGGNGIIGWNVYVTSGATGTETKQNLALINIGTNFQEPNTGLIAGTALPIVNNANLSVLVPVAGTWQEPAAGLVWISSSNCYIT